VIELRRQNAVPFAMTRKEIDPTTSKVSSDYLVGRFAKWSVDGEFFGIFEAVNIIQAAATNDADCGRNGWIKTHVRAE
jgi:hypothetical protein